MKIINLIFKNEKFKLSSPFGNRKVMNVKNVRTNKFHSGADYSTYGKKLKQYAVENGEVITTGKDSYGALYVKIKYPSLKVRMDHWHLDKILVKKGDKVNTDTIIGITGKTGLATGIHLHLQIYDYTTKEYIDPETYNYKENSSPNKYYIVKKGDNLTKIGKKYNLTWKNIYKNNKDIIGDNPDLIQPGMKLLIK